MNQKYRVGLIAGSFDLIHPGYVWLFQDAKKVCEYLVIALQEDPSVERKSKLKPVLTWEERAEILMAIRYVDDVMDYTTEDDLVRLILEVKPDVRILGSDYVGKNVTGKMKIPIHFHVRDHGWSTTKLKRMICEERNMT